MWRFSSREKLLLVYREASRSDDDAWRIGLSLPCTFLRRLHSQALEQQSRSPNELLASLSCFGAAPIDGIQCDWLPSESHLILRHPWAFSSHAASGESDGARVYPLCEQVVGL